MKYIFTNHLRKRFVQRYVNPKRYGSLDICECRTSHRCFNCRKLLKELDYELLLCRDLDREISRCLENSTEEKHFLNDTNFMARKYEKYGYDSKFTFRLYDKVVFLILEDERGKVVPTCFAAKGHIAGQIKPKFRKNV